MKLSVAGQQRARGFIKSKARPLEQAQYAFYFDKAGPVGVWQDLAAFQNPDGGFGHGLEPDVTLRDSSTICTVRGLQALGEVKTPSDHALVAGAIRYLLTTYDPITEAWEIVPRTVNNEPHAPWWHYDEEGQAKKWGCYLVNPRAEILGCLSTYSAIVPAEFLHHLSAAILAHLENGLDLKDMHEICCYLNLLETKSLPDEFRRRLLTKLEPIVAQAVQRDPAKWGSYCLKPAGYMGVVRSPASPFAEMLAKEVALQLDHEIEHQHTDGSWLPAWSWGGSYPEAWEQAKLAWQGIKTVEILKVLSAFRRL